MNIPSERRIDYTTPENYLPIYTIDPEGCEDADDAFSLVERNGQTLLYIHIADPTDEFSPNDELFHRIVSQGTTKYSLHSAPNHLFPRPLVIKQSLMEPDPECPFNNLTKRPAISIVFSLSSGPEQRVIGTPRIEFTYIKCDPNLRQTYERAAEMANQVPILKKCLDIGDAMWGRRVNVGQKLAKLVKARPVKDKNTGRQKFYVDPEPVRNMKRMIGEFAIASNTCVAEYLKTHNIYFVRHCQGLPDGSTPGTADEIMLEIIKKGIRANQDTANLRHLLVGDSLQTHFTSPLRRASDCIVHFLLKSTYLQVDPPFEPEEMGQWAMHLNTCFSEDKKRQFGEIKRVSMFIISDLIRERGSVNVGWKQTGYTGLFLNAMIMEVNEFPVNISITLREKNLNISVNGSMRHTRISTVNPGGKFDNQIIPELAEAMVN